jgi:hypothetical protein
LPFECNLQRYSTGLLENPFDDVVAGSVFPGGRFDPLVRRGTRLPIA